MANITRRWFLKAIATAAIRLDALHALLGRPSEPIRLRYVGHIRQRFLIDQHSGLSMTLDTRPRPRYLGRITSD